MRFSQRVQSLPPYLFAGIERKIAARRATGADVISLGIGDPDLPTPAHIISALAEGAADSATHQYPSNQGESAFREAVAGYYMRRFGVAVDPDTQVMPLLGAKEGIAHIGLAMLDQCDVALATDPGYPVYVTGPLLADGTTVPLPLVPELGFQPDLDAIEPSVLAKARMIFVCYPNNPTGAVIEADFFARLVAFAPEPDLLVVHDNAYADITYDGYVAPSFLETPGACDVGVEMLSLSKSYNMTGWRAGALVGNREVVDAFWRLKTNMDSGMSERCNGPAWRPSAARRTACARCVSCTSGDGTCS
jgi:LL-diaminopimelate aminotransferase